MQAGRVLGMNAGRELDAMVAEKVFGWEPAVNPWGDGRNIGWNLPPCIPNELERRTWSRDPLPYSTDISAAWQVVEKIGLGIQPCGDGWVCGIPGNRSKPSVLGASAPLAICLAAMKAVGVKVPS